MKQILPLFIALLLVSNLCVASNDTDIQNAKKATQYQPDKDVGIDNLCGIDIKEKTERIKTLSNEAEKHIKEKLDQITKMIEEIRAKIAQDMNSIQLKDNTATTP